MQYYSLSLSLRDFGYAVGFGGGLAVILGQSQFAVAFLVTASRFEYNMAVVGGAAYIGIFTYVRNSSVLFSNCIFDSNTAWFIGGGIGLLNDLDRYDGDVIIEQGSVKTTVEISGSTFENCIAKNAGGAINILSDRFSARRIVSGSVRILLLQSILRQNIAGKGGAAIDCRETLADGRHLGMQLEISDTVISESSSTTNPVSLLTTTNVPSAVSVYQMNITLSGNTNIRDNLITGLFTYGGVIGIHGNVSFVNNTGVFGGAMNLQAFSFLVVTYNSSLQMINNTARVFGGALYIDQESRKTFVQCFLYFSHDQFVYCNNCSNLNNTGAQIVFSGNIADRGSDIYGSLALSMCPWSPYNPWPVSYVQLSQLFPTVFNFDRLPQGIENVEGLPSTMVIADKQPVYPLSPGQSVLLNITTYDDLNQTRSNVISSFVDVLIDSDAVKYTFLLNGALEISIDEKSPNLLVTLLATKDTPRNITLQIFSTIRFVSQTITVEVRPCYDGFEFNNMSQKCQCIKPLTDSGVTCSEASLEFVVPYENWLGYVDGRLAVIPACLAKYCQSCTVNNTGCVNENIIVKNNAFDSQCVSILNRGGIACKTCKNNYSETFGINSVCMQCTNIPLLIIVVGGLLAGVILTWLIAYFRLTVGFGYTNGILFYCNILSVYAGQLVSVKPGYALVIASWMSLNIGVDTCFYNGMSSVGRVGFGFVFPVYLFGILLAITIIAHLDRPLCCRHKKCSCSLVHFSTVQMFATLLVLCYTGLMEASVEALAPYIITDVYGNKTVRWFADFKVEYFSDPGHKVVGTFGAIFMILYIIPFPLFLFSPRLVYKSRFLCHLKPIYDVLWEPFEPHLRCWLSLQLLFIAIAFGLQYFLSSPMNIVVVLILLIIGLFAQVVLKPYKSAQVNTFNSFLLLDLIIIFVVALFYNLPIFQTTVGELESQDVLTLVLVMVAYLSIVVYHVYQRFPWCKSLAASVIGKFRKGVRTENGNQNATSDNREMNGPVNDNLRFTTLREPLLEE